MTLEQIFRWCQKKSYFSRDDEEIWEAISGAAHLIYKEVVLENSGFFIAFDTTSLVLAAGQEEYQLPAPVEQLVRLREQLPGETYWRVINPSGLNDAPTLGANFGYLLDAGTSDSRFVYNGPYLKQSDAQSGDDINSLRIEPIPQETHNCELVYTAKFIEITGPESPLVIEPEGHDALKNLAVVELLEANDDDNAQSFLERGNTHKMQYLKLVRARQVQRVRTVEPYISDMD